MPVSRFEDAVILNRPDVIGNDLLEWVELLQHPKTVKVATSCLVYIGNALSKRKMASTVQVKVSRGNIMAHDGRAALMENGTIALGRRTRIELFGSNQDDEKKIDKPCIALFSPERQIYDGLEDISLDQCAKMFVEFINRVSEKKHQSQSCMPDFNIIRVITRCLHGRGSKNTEWSDIHQSYRTKKSIKKISNFLLKRNNKACTPLIAQLLLDAILYIEIKSRLKESVYIMHLASPVHEAVLAKDLDALIMLLSHEFIQFSKDGDDFDDGNFPLFHAVKLDYPIIAKTLVVFAPSGYERSFDCRDEYEIKKFISTNPDISQEMQELVEKIFDERKIDEGDNMNIRTRKEFEEMAKKRLHGVKITHLLSLDGGGIRGLVLTTILKELEIRIPDIVDKFEWIAGTSTGAILALALAAGYNIDQCRDIYFKFKDVVFTPAKSDYLNYDTNYLEQFLRKTFEIPNVTPPYMFHLGEMSRKKIIATSVEGEKELKMALFKSYSLHPSYEHFNTVYDTFEHCTAELVPPQNSEKRKPPALCESAGSNFNECNQFVPNPITSSIVTAARATSAAPTYFEPVKVDNSPTGDNSHKKYSASYIDGGVKNNNPTTQLVKEWEKYKQAIECYNKEMKDYGETEEQFEKVIGLGAVLSIGTGMMKEVEKEDDSELSKRVHEWFREIKEAGRFLLKAFGQLTESDGEPVDLSKSYTNANRGAFFRLTPTFEFVKRKKDNNAVFKEKIGLDETDNKTLIEMMWRTKMYMRTEEHYITNLKKVLLYDEYE